MSRPGGNPEIGHVSKAIHRTGVNASAEGGLFNDADPHHVLNREQPIHRLIVEAYLADPCTKTVAEKLEVSRQTVKNTLRQPFARKMIREKYAELGEEELKRILKDVAPNSIWNIVELSNEAASEAVKLAANREILDRYLGKPKESLEVSQKAASDMTDAELKEHLLSKVNGS